MDNINENQAVPVEIIIRDTAPSDFQAVSDIFRKEYGEGYVYNDIYTSDRFEELISRKGVHSIVAETADGRIAGHHALKEWSDIPDVYEGGMAVVNPDIRKSGAFNKMMAANNAYFDDVIKSGVLISGASTAHEITQKTRLKYGFTPCGFMYNVMPKGFTLENFPTECKRHGEALSVHVADHSEKTIYAPKEAKELIDRVCEGEKLPRTIITDDPDITVDHTIINEEISENDPISRAVIRSVGADYRTVLEKLVFDLKANESAVCPLLFAIEKPGAVSLYEEAKKYGMHLCAYIPNTGYGDLLVMAYELNNLVEYDKLVTYGSFADMMELIRSFDPMDKFNH